MPHPLILQGFGGVAPKVYFASTYIHSILQQPTFYLCKKHKSTDGRTEKYFYNNRNQLTELHREKDVVRYSYDPAGNLTEENYLTADGASTKKLHYAYDVYNRNVSVTGDDFTQKNHYDAEGYRDSITEKDKVTNLVYQGGMLLHELDEDKNPARHYVLGNEYIGLDHNYYLTDEQGSVRYVLDAAGNVQNDYQYDAFGQRIAGHENIPNRLKYNAQIEDDLTGLYYLRARYYNTDIGRFTQEDVIYNDGLNLYAYCSSNPVMYSDPSGYAGGSVKQKTCGSKESGRYSKTYYEGTTKVGGQINDISRTVYQRNDIDWNRIDPATGLTNKQLAQAGSAPYANDGTKIELHHLLQQEPGPMVEIPASLHDKYYKTLHGLVGDGESFRNNPNLEKQYNNFRAKYWRWRAKNL